MYKIQIENKLKLTVVRDVKMKIRIAAGGCPFSNGKHRPRNIRNFTNSLTKSLALSFLIDRGNTHTHTQEKKNRSQKHKTPENIQWYFFRSVDSNVSARRLAVFFPPLNPCLCTF